MNAPDILEYIRAALAPDTQTLARLEPILNQARHTYGGETVYIRAPERIKVTRRTAQNRQKRAVLS